MNMYVPMCSCSWYENANRCQRGRCKGPFPGLRNSYSYTFRVGQ